VIEELDVRAPRPRKRTDGEVIALRERALAVLALGASRASAAG
jgi:hypothetical protein